MLKWCYGMIFNNHRDTFEPPRPFESDDRIVWSLFQFSTVGTENGNKGTVVSNTVIFHGNNSNLRKNFEVTSLSLVKKRSSFLLKPASRHRVGTLFVLQLSVVFDLNIDFGLVWKRRLMSFVWRGSTPPPLLDFCLTSSFFTIPPSHYL
jgi:hypothetical protein